MLEVGCRVPDGHWQCVACLALRPSSDFRPQRSSTLGHAHWCKDCWPPRATTTVGRRAQPAPRRRRAKPVLQSHKPCVVCRIVRDLCDFYPDSLTYDGLSSWCKGCQRGNAAYARRTRPRDVWSTKLKQEHGISADDYDRMFEAQAGCCAICGEPETALGKRLAVDHDHRTGKNRQLLCMNCNQLLGKAHEDAEVLRRAIRYLERHAGGDS